jgi:membrane protease YdiL (CAAX protease family)
MNPIAKWVQDPKHATIVKRVSIYLPLFIRIIFVVMVWCMWVVFTHELVFAIHPLRSWVIPLVSAALFCLAYIIVRKFDRGLRTAYLFRSVRTAAPWIATAWIVFACFRFFFLIAYIHIFGISEKPPDRFHQYASMPYGLIAAMLLAYIFAPVSEELTFRGLIQRALEEQCTPIVTIVSTAALFAIVHLDGEMVVPHFFGGLVYGYAVFVTRSVWAGVILHAGHNVLTGALTLWIGDWATRMNMFATAAITMALLLLLIWCCIKLWKTRLLDTAGQQN